MIANECTHMFDPLCLIHWQSHYHSINIVGNARMFGINSYFYSLLFVSCMQITEDSPVFDVMSDKLCCRYFGCFDCENGFVVSVFDFLRKT